MILLVGWIAVSLLLISIFIVLTGKEKFSTIPYVHSLPRDSIMLNISESSGGKAELLGLDKILWESDKYLKKFHYFGIYNGDVFQVRHRKDNKILMEVIPKLNPNNGIVNGFAVFNFTKEGLKITVFLDKDWKEQVKGKTNIIWSSDFQHIKEFSWQEISPGIYMDFVIERNVSRFKRKIKHSVEAKIAVVNASKGKFRKIYTSNWPVPKDIVSIVIR